MESSSISTGYPVLLAIVANREAVMSSSVVWVAVGVVEDVFVLDVGMGKTNQMLIITTMGPGTTLLQCRMPENRCVLLS